MVSIFRHHVSIFILYCVSLHYMWAAMLWFRGEEVVGATAVHALYLWVKPSWLLSVVLFAAASLALWAVFLRNAWQLMIPQQVAMMVSAGGAIGAVLLSQYADGVIRPQMFIAADQAHSILAAVAHTVAILAYVRAAER